MPIANPDSDLLFWWCTYHDDVIKWKHFPRYWPFVRGIHRSPVNFPHKGQWRGALMFSLICARVNDMSLETQYACSSITLILRLVRSKSFAKHCCLGSDALLSTRRSCDFRSQFPAFAIQRKYQRRCASMITGCIYVCDCGGGAEALRIYSLTLDERY